MKDNTRPALKPLLPSKRLPFPSLVTRWYIEFRIWFGKRFLKQLPPIAGGDSDDKDSIKFGPYIINVGFGQYLKIASSANEVQVMKHVRSHTSIPVPKVYGAWTWSDSRADHCYLLMEKVPGEDLRSAWPRLKNSQRMKIARQIARLVRKLHKVHQPAEFRGTVSSFIGGPIDDAGLNPVWYQSKDWFESVYAFVDEILRPIAREERSDLAAERGTLLQKPNCRLVLTHGDLTMRNIMVDPITAKITGIIDWTTAAFMPIYWEPYKAEWAETKLSRQKREFIATACGTFPDELAILSRRGHAIAGKSSSVRRAEQRRRQSLITKDEEEFAVVK